MTDDNTPDRDATTRREALSMVEERTEKPTQRRSFLRTTAAGIVGALGFTGTAAAIDPTRSRELDAVRREFADDEAAVRGALETHATDLLERLSEKGYLDAADVDEALKGSVEVGGLHVDDEPTAHVHVERRIDGERVGINVEPHVGRAYAFITSESDDDRQATIVDTSYDEPIEPQCPYIWACIGDDGCTCPSYEVACCSYGCYTNGQNGTCSSCADCIYTSCEDVC
jgi:hypothetical protein